jgi:16S rRNA pseudouridine516 synthase
MRLDRLLANMKFGSRREVQDMIFLGQVTINGEVTTKKDRKVNPNLDKIVVNGEEIYYKEEIILAMNKPIGYLSANRDDMHPVVIDLLKPPYHRHNFKIAGRLDLDAEGLLILTTSGKTVHLISNPNQNIVKTYEVTTNLSINDKMLLRLLEPIRLLDGMNNPYLAKAIEVSKIGNNIATISIDSGKYHQVKRMFKAIGYEVTNLKRIKIGKYLLSNLKPGEYLEIALEDIL